MMVSQLGPQRIMKRKASIQIVALTQQHKRENQSNSVNWNTTNTRYTRGTEPDGIDIYTKQQTQYQTGVRTIVTNEREHGGKEKQTKCPIWNKTKTKASMTDGVALC